MSSVTLVMVLHDHQPIGNFGGVFRQAYEDAYAPFLSFLERHPRLRLGLHTSGPLLEWIEANEPAYLERLRSLVARGQVEPWGGGFYEPILPAIPEVDRQGQIRLMADWLERMLGKRPLGLWLTERVWEPSLASSLATAGVEYTAADDAHFVAAGLERDELWGSFLTEDQGRRLTLLPIHRELRYLVPFAEPEQTIELLRRVARGGPDRIAVLGDDGEKFGVWPGTKQHCYESGWLERFAQAVEREPWIRVMTPAEAVAAHAPRGLVYLPSASYHEMEEWALPPAAQERRRHALEILRPEMGEAAMDLLRGGHWRAFQSRYPESNRMHKRMLRASRRIAEPARASHPRMGEARTHLWRAQMNCPYWHGVFGGLYLPHLRAAVYRELIAAETLAGPGRPQVERGDLDFDGDLDALLENREWAAWISSRGARLWAFDDRERRWNYGDTLARRPEPYHARLREAEVGGGEGKSIHEAVRWKDSARMDLLEGWDERGRDSFLDRWEESGVAHEWARELFALEAADEGVVAHRTEGDAPGIEKRFAPSPQGGLEVLYTLTSARARRGALHVTLNLGLHVPDADDRWVEVNGSRAQPSHWAARARHERVESLAFVDEWADRRIEVRFDHSAVLERAPIETVSLSEAGAEAIFQGIEAALSFEVTLEAGVPWTLRFRLAPLSASAASKERAA